MQFNDHNKEEKYYLKLYEKTNLKKLEWFEKFGDVKALKLKCKIFKDASFSFFPFIKTVIFRVKVDLAEPRYPPKKRQWRRMKILFLALNVKRDV